MLALHYSDDMQTIWIVLGNVHTGYGVSHWTPATAIADARKDALL